MSCNNDENMMVYISSFCYKFDLVKSKHEHGNDYGDCKSFLQQQNPNLHDKTTNIRIEFLAATYS